MTEKEPQELRVAKKTAGRLTSLLGGSESTSVMEDGREMFSIMANSDAHDDIDEMDFDADGSDDLYDTPEQPAFEERKFDWVNNASVRPDQNVSAADPQLPLDQIIDAISDDLERDGTYEYAREETEQHYFDNAWNGAEQFRETQAYLTSLHGHAEHIYDKSDGWKSLSYPPPKSMQDIESNLSKIKGDIEKFEHHMEAYAGSLKYQLKQVETVRSYIPAVLNSLKGDYFTNDTKDIALNSDQEKEAFAIIKNQLEEKEVDSPLILDHVKSSLNHALSMKEGFDPKAIDGYFAPLGEHIRTNLDSAHAMQKYAADTRVQLDKVVQQECRKGSIEL